LLKVLRRLTRDLFVLLVQQSDNISTETERRAGLSAIAEPLVVFTAITLCDLKMM